MSPTSLSLAAAHRKGFGDLQRHYHRIDDKLLGLFNSNRRPFAVEARTSPFYRKLLDVALECDEKCQKYLPGGFYERRTRR